MPSRKLWDSEDVKDFVKDWYYLVSVFSDTVFFENSLGQIAELGLSTTQGVWLHLDAFICRKSIFKDAKHTLKELISRSIIPDKEYQYQCLDLMIALVDENLPRDEASVKVAFKYTSLVQVAEYCLSYISDQWLEAAYEVEKQASNVMRSMEMRGISLDTMLLENMKQETSKRMQEAAKKFSDATGGNIDIWSSTQLADYLYWQLKIPTEGIKVWAKRPSTDSSTLESLKHFAPEVIDAVLVYRDMLKVQSTYIDGLLSRTDSWLIKTTYHPNGTVTGRVSSSSPNLQSISSRSDEFNVRKAFVPRTWFKFIDADFSQIEVRVIAALAKDVLMQKAFLEESDIHQSVADKVGCSRQIAKNIVFGLCYGQGINGLSAIAKISFSEAKEFVKKFFQEFPWAKTFMLEAKRDVEESREVKMISGRRRRFPEYVEKPNKEQQVNNARIIRQAWNSKIQGSAAYVMKLAIVSVQRMLDKKYKWKAFILLTIHDELLVEVAEDIVDCVALDVKNSMESCIVLENTPLKVEVKISDYWTK